MKERPILFSGPMVRALLAGTKTQTRREITSILKRGKITEFGKSDTPGYDWTFLDRGKLWHDLRHAELMERCPYGQPGDRLWVRETWKEDLSPCCDGSCGHQNALYRADFGEGPEWRGGWAPSIHMPKCASRITLEITGVRVERLQQISEPDAYKEGIRLNEWEGDDGEAPSSSREAFEWLWNSINGSACWGENPWVWVIEFHRVD